MTRLRYHPAAARVGGPQRRSRTLLPQGLAREILSQPGLEGDPLGALAVSEAYWRVCQAQIHIKFACMVNMVMHAMMMTRTH